MYDSKREQDSYKAALLNFLVQLNSVKLQLEDS